MIKNDMCIIIAKLINAVFALLTILATIMSLLVG